MTYVTADEVRRLVLLGPCKSTLDLDPIPTNLVMDYIDILITPIKSIINLSLNGGFSNSQLKSGIVLK